MAIRNIRQYEDPILKKKCKAVNDISPKIKMFLNDMLDTLRGTENGVAIAANQVGILYRLVVIEWEEKVYKLVNPRIVKQSGEQFTVEGCLSFPDIWGKVRRPNHVVVTALDENGKEFQIEADGFLAKCLAHELDHLDGQTFVEKIEEYE